MLPAPLSGPTGQLDLDVPVHDRDAGIALARCQVRLDRRPQNDQLLAALGLPARARGQGVGKLGQLEVFAAGRVTLPRVLDPSARCRVAGHGSSVGRVGQRT
jgi:hypothetical protein